jgi:NAD-dependent deacetylase
MHHPIDPDDALTKAVALLRRAKRVAVLTGAGVSAESGVPTFRGAGGLWEGHAVEEVATPMAFAKDPALVWRFYNARRNRLLEIKPNPGHYALVQLESRFALGDFALATQNVDGLHLAAGSKNVLELHGNLGRVRCSKCDHRADRRGELLEALPTCPDCGHLLRPDIVWFHEMLPEDVWQKAGRAVGTCNCLLVAGTSAVVWPAAGLIDLAREYGATVIEVNIDRTEASAKADVCLYGPSGELLPRLVDALM